VCLWQDDNGLELPVNPHLLGLSAITWDRALHGIPFFWAQSLCGLHFVPPRLDALSAASGRPVTLTGVLAALHHRCLVQASLTTQLATLKQKRFPNSIAPPVKTRVKFESWAPLARADFARVCHASPYLNPPRPAADSHSSASSSSSSSHETREFDWWSEGSQCFSAVFSKGATELTAYIQITPEYPIRPPLLCLAFTKTADPLPDAVALAQLEQEVNTYLSPDSDFHAVIEAEEAGSGYLLSHVVCQVQSSFDMFTAATATRPSTSSSVQCPFSSPLKSPLDIVS
jgi:hypothetical protein